MLSDSHIIGYIALKLLSQSQWHMTTIANEELGNKCKVLNWVRNYVDFEIKDLGR